MFYNDNYIISVHAFSANSRPSIDGPSALYTEVGQTATITATAWDTDGDNLTIVMMSPVRVTSLTQSGNVTFSYSYSPVNMTPCTVE
jgi:hypothetical protein